MGVPRRVVALVVSTGLGVPLASACGGGAFACSEHAQCGGDGGVCEADGWCSFPDADCPSGQRFGEHAGEGLGGSCVPGGTTTGTVTSAVTSEITSEGTDPEVGTGTSRGSSGDSISTTNAIDDASTSSGTIVDEGTSGSESTGTPSDPSLVAWYTFDDPDDPYADASGNGLDAWCGDECPALGDGVVGGAIQVAGFEHVHVDHGPELELQDGFTVAVWARVDHLPDGFVSIIAKPVGLEAFNSWQLGIGPSNRIQGSAWLAGGGNTMEQRGAFAPFEADSIETWHHIALTWSDELRLYLDGSVVDSSSTTQIEYDDQPMMIGADANYGADDAFFYGSIDDVRLYDRVLDDMEIAGLAISRP